MLHGLCSRLHSPGVQVHGFRVLGAGRRLEAPAAMLTLTTLVLLSQVGASEWAPPPLVTVRAPARSARLAEAEAPAAPSMVAASPAAEVRATPRSARLADLEPRLSGGALAGRMATATLGGALGLAAGFGVATAGVYLGTAAFSGVGYTLGFIAGLALSAPIALGLVAVGLAAGASLFGQHFGHAFAGAVPVAGIMVISAALAATVLAFLMGPVVAVLVAASVAFVLTPVFIEARKPELRPLSAGRDLQAAGGLSVAF